MNETALQVVYKAIAARLTTSGEIWGNRVRASVVKADTPYPYVVQFWAGGGQVHMTTGRDAELVIGVKCVSDKLADAMQGAARIATRLDEHGRQDDATDYLVSGTEWDILSITEEETLYLVEQDAPDTIPIYHVGAFYRFVMEL